MRAGLLILCCAAIGCSASHKNGGTPDLAMPSMLGDPSLTRLIESDFTLPAGSERYSCKWQTITEDTYIVRVVAVAPTAVHHVVLSIESNVQPDGVADCGSFASSWQTLFASGENSPELDLPSDVALKIAAGQQIVLDLHLLNATQGSISATGAVDVALAADPSQVQLAGATWIGPPSFTVPSSMQVDGTCTISNDARYFALYPHMHDTGAHMTVATSGSVNQVVWNQDFDVMNQTFGSWAPMQLRQGDQIKVTCTYSPAGIGRTFGNASTNEMCYAVSYFTPPISGELGTPACFF
jgi:Copper type II ascorbate-dependent monooxygenase, C-terminal domain